MIEMPADRDDAIRAMAANRDLIRRAQALDFQYAAHIADLYGDIPDTVGYALPGTERLVQVGSDGTPEVAEFTCLEISAALGIRSEEAEALLGHALDVRHRHPRLWQLLDTGQVRVWQAIELATIARPLQADECRVFDHDITTMLPGMSWKRLADYAKALVLDLLPHDQADTLRAAALDRRRVRFGQSNGVTALDGCLDAADGILLNAQLDRIAGILATGGNTDSRDARRATSLGILANPGRALQVLQASLLDQLPTSPDDFDDCFRAGQAGHTCGTITVDPDQLLPRADLVVHLTDGTLDQADGLVRVEKLGPMLAEWAAEMLAHHRVTVRPVIDTNHLAASDAYETPGRMRQAIQWRNPTEVFPWSTRSSARCDLDHTVPYDPDGPPGQTNPANLGPLSRKVHRAKTHGGWQLAQPEPGIYVWTSPLGHRYLVTRSHTIPLDPTPPPVLLAAA